MEHYMATIKNNIQQIHDLGQSVWCDSISRAMISTGELQRLIDLGVVGVTSNPTIFMKAITASSDYDARINELLRDNPDTLALYEGLVIPDIIDAADILRPVHEATDTVDGFISLEVNPQLAYDTEATIAEARRLFGEIARPNVYIKVPATDEGLPAIEALIADGINVNVTLIFGLDVYDQVMAAYISGLHALAESGGDVSAVSSVASFFVSRVDTLIDSLLEEKRAGGESVDHLLGQAAIANARLAYARFSEVFDAAGPFGVLALKGARVQRPLWASTSTKNPAYSDTIYVDNLIGPHTVNTMPLATIEATLDHADPQVTIDEGVDVAAGVFEELSELGISIESATRQLRTEGVAAFAQSFNELLANLNAKQSKLKTAVQH